MKKAPGIYTVENLVRGVQQSQAHINGRWVPSRPLGYFSFWWRLKAAWLVFVGECDLVRWPEGQ